MYHVYLVEFQVDIAIREVKFDVYGKRQTANFCRLSSALCTVESRYLYLQ